MPTEYIHFTTEQKEAARQTDIVALLQSRGERLKRSGKEYVWRDGSEKVKIRENLWFHQYERIGGDAVDFVRRFYNMDFPQAVNLRSAITAAHFRKLSRSSESRQSRSPFRRKTIICGGCMRISSTAEE